MQLQERPCCIFCYVAYISRFSKNHITHQWLLVPHHTQTAISSVKVLIMLNPTNCLQLHLYVDFVALYTASPDFLLCCCNNYFSHERSLQNKCHFSDFLFLAYQVLPPLTRLENIPTTCKNIQWFHAYKCLNTDSNDGLWLLAQLLTHLHPLLPFRHGSN